MGHTCTHDEYPEPDGNDEHPIVAVLAVLAMVAAVLMITWVRLEIHGTGDIEAALAEQPAQGDLPVAPKPDLKPDEGREVEAAVTSSRFATGFSP